ncbi:MAG TPA: endonuclease/exonuclease/phosphatase family protein, partial [Candidatus Limnocylindrales bacterium]|nr:endonuclease/exonuclease/phosphatase family protein [Candidatus Limnocylindrales bacterium]
MTLSRRLLALVTIPYAVLILLYFALRVLAWLGLPVSDTDGGLFGSFVGIVSSLMPIVLVPSLPLVLLAALLRMPRLALLLAPIGLSFALLYGGLFLPRPAHSLTAAEPLTVYTHNLHVQSAGLEAATEAIRASGADVVALQELTNPAAAYLRAALSDLYPYDALYPVGSTTSGTGILSRWPLRDAEAWRASMMQVRTVVERPGAPFAFYSLHPPPPHWFLRPFDATGRAQALTSALERTAQETLPVVLAGDFN